MRVLVIISLFITITWSRSILDSLNFMPPHQLRNYDKVYLNETYFPTLEDYQVNAAPVSEKQYPWIARVVHSRSSDKPHVCTAVCIEEAIFITAARCINTLKVNHTRIIYMTKRLSALAFVVPSNPSKQLFDDIGFVVVDPKSFKGMWAVIELFDTTNRTDEAFKWFAELNNSHNDINYKVVGYASVKGANKLKLPVRHYDLSELNVIVSLDICPSLLTDFGKVKGFRVPCYHSCTVQQFKKRNEKCESYHGVEGGAIFDTVSNKLMGVATWGVLYSKYELPVGFSIVNSVNFFTDLVCARRIRSDKRQHVKIGYYQSLCDA